MGAKNSKRRVYLDSGSSNDIIQIQEEIQRKLTVPLRVVISHYTPPFFPILPIITRETTSLCRASWNTIVKKDSPDPYGGPPISGITAFYNDFYDTLEKFDSSGKIEAILVKHSNGKNKIAAKGSILIRIIEFMLKIDEDNHQNMVSIYMLGKAHSKRAIRPWQYSIFTQTLLMTISNRLGNEASGNLMEAWVNLFAYVLQRMLPAAIKDNVVETEIHVNTSTTFSDGKVAEEVQDIEEVKSISRLHSGLHTPHSSGSGRYSSMKGISINHQLERVGNALIPENGSVRRVNRLEPQIEITDASNNT